MIVATANSRKSLQWKNKDVSWGDLVKRFSRTVYTDETEEEYASMPKDRKLNVKDVGGLVGGKLSGPQRKKEALVDRCILALDIDYGSADTWDDLTMMCDWECLMHTTHSHTKDKPRYRLYFPLSRPISRDEYAPVGRMVASIIGIELFDDTTFEAERLMFWPSTCKGGEFKVWTQTGPWLDPDAILGMYNDWHDESTWPISSRVTEVVKKSTKDRQQDPREKSGIVGAFCKVYDIYGAIDKYLSNVYEPTDEKDRYTYSKGSTSKGLKVFDDGLFAQSWHDSDPAHGRLCNAFDLVRIHLFPDMDEKKSYNAMRTCLDSDADVKDALDEMLFEAGRKMFEDGFFDEFNIRNPAELTETGNANRLKRAYNERMCYNPSLKWCCWDAEEGVWKTDDEADAVGNVLTMNNGLLAYADEMIQTTRPANAENIPKTKYPPDYQQALKTYQWAVASMGWRNISNTLSVARGIFRTTPTDAFDSDPWDLNTPDGVVNLRTGEIRSHSPHYKCTMITTVSPDWDMPHDGWDAFLELITCGDRDMEDFLQQVAGMALVGDMYEECIVMCYGTGSNGKSTLFQIWTELMGGYAGSMRNEVLIGNKFGTDVFGADALRGKRLVIASELENQQTISNSMLKKLASRDAINTNVKYAKAITFKPTHTLVIHTNHLPRLKMVDYGTIRRVNIIPFKATISQQDKKNDFAEDLIRSEGPAILAWMIDGAVKFYNNNMKLERPPCIKNASEAYIEGEDILNRFVSECCVEGPDVSECVGVLYSAFRNWCEEEGLYCYLGRNKFGQELCAKKGYKTVPDRQGKRIMGLAPVEAL